MDTPAPPHLPLSFLAQEPGWERRLALSRFELEEELGFLGTGKRSRGREGASLCPLFPVACLLWGASISWSEPQAAKLCHLDPTLPANTLDDASVTDGTSDGWLMRALQAEGSAPVMP